MKPRYWVCFDCLPEPNTSVEREIGRLTVNDKPLLYSNRVGRLGQHKSKEQATQGEWEDFLETKEEIEEDYLLGLHYDDY